MGSLRRSALSASRLRVSFFSSASSRSLASSHCSYGTTSGRAITASLTQRQELGLGIAVGETLFRLQYTGTGIRSPTGY